MADISKITPPGSQTTYNLKDSTAREQANWNTNNGVKNLIKSEMVQAGEYSSVTYTVNSDGSITVNGTATGGVSYVYISINNHPIDIKQFCDGNHILTGCPSGGSASGYKLYAAKGNYAKYDYGNGVLLTETSETEVFLVIAIPQGVTVNNLVFHPMIRSVTVEDDTYEPYALPNTKITPELIDLVDSGAKNLVSLSTLTGTRWFDNTINLPAGDYVLYLASLTTTASASVCQVGVLKGGDVALVSYTSIAVGNNVYVSFSISETATKLRIYAAADSSAAVDKVVTVTNPMICTKAAWDVSQKFVPYRPTYEETVEQVAENENNILLNARKTKQILYTTVAANTYEIVSDIAITVPAGKVLEFSAYAYSYATSCLAIKAIIGNDPSIATVLLAESDTGTNSRTCQNVTGVYYNAAAAERTVNFYVKYNGTGSNMIGVVYNIYDNNNSQ